MRYKIYTILTICVFVFTAQSFLTDFKVVPGTAAQTQRDGASVMIGNAPISANLDAVQKAVPLKGNLSLHFEISPDQLKNGFINVRRFNIAFFNVRQAAISGRETATKQGVLGMTIPPPSDNVRLRYDAQTRTASGEIPVQVHFSQLDEFFPPEIIKGNGREDDFAVSRTMRGRVKIQLKFTEPLDKAAAEAAQSNRASRLTAQVSAEVEVEPLPDNRYGISNFRMQIGTAQIITEIGGILRFEAGSRLCLQPVRIRSSASDPTPTGAGLAFGTPGANTQWNKADVTFQVQPWMTVTNSAWKVMTDGENAAIRASVNVDDCVEIFFVENFDPVSL